jgi:diguanylate cyclase (GGDEF)-like protein
VVTVISRFRVRNGREEDVRKAFLNRPRLVESAHGFRGIDILTDAADPSAFLLITRWTDEESFRSWHRSEAHHKSHQLIPKGLKLDASQTSVTVARSIQDQAGLLGLAGAVESRVSAVAQWLIDSGEVFALLLEQDGAIRSRNRAAERVFPAPPEGDTDTKVWSHLVCSDAERLRQRLSDDQADDSFLLNLVDEGHDPITFEARLLGCEGAFLLLGVQERRHDTRFQSEVLRLTNDLALAVREAARKNRELEKAKETIELLARTDILTGLANRRMLEETLPREVARADRLKESLSVIFADLDMFKPVNDRLGHNAGDRLLARLGEVLKSQIRAYALAVRFGGDEFVLLLPGTTTTGALLIAERIRKKVEELAMTEFSIPVTVSLGVATLASGETGEKLIARADEALYRAKKKGGNRVDAA